MGPAVFSGAHNSDNYNSFVCINAQVYFGAIKGLFAHQASPYLSSKFENGQDQDNDFEQDTRKLGRATFGCIIRGENEIEWSSKWVGLCPCTSMPICLWRQQLIIMQTR